MDAIHRHKLLLSINIPIIIIIIVIVIIIIIIIVIIIITIIIIVVIYDYDDRYVTLYFVRKLCFLLIANSLIRFLKAVNEDDNLYINAVPVKVRQTSFHHYFI